MAPARDGGRPMIIESVRVIGGQTYDARDYDITVLGDRVRVRSRNSAYAYRYHDLPSAACIITYVHER